MSSWTCSTEIGFDPLGDSELCGKPAVVLIDRRQDGHQAVCADCLDQRLYEEIHDKGLVYYFRSGDRWVPPARRPCPCHESTPDPVRALAGVA